MGSSSRRASGLLARTWARRTRSLKPPERVDSGSLVDLRPGDPALPGWPPHGPLPHTRRVAVPPLQARRSDRRRSDPRPEPGGPPSPPWLPTTRDCPSWPRPGWSRLRRGTGPAAIRRGGPSLEGRPAHPRPRYLPARMFRNVVFPEPLAPTRPYGSPAFSWNDAPEKQDPVTEGLLEAADGDHGSERTTGPAKRSPKRVRRRPRPTPGGRLHPHLRASSRTGTSVRSNASPASPTARHAS